MEYRTRSQFSELEPEAKYKVMREMWNRDLPDSVKANMLMTLSEWQNGVSQWKAIRILFDEIHLGLMDEAPQTQQQAATLLFWADPALVFPTPTITWRGANAAPGKPLADLVEGRRGGVRRRSSRKRTRPGKSNF